MKIFVVVLFFTTLSVVIVESQAQGRSIFNRSQQNGNNRVGRNSAKSGGSTRGNSAKPRNFPKHVAIRKSIHNKPIYNKPIHNKPIFNKPISKKTAPNRPTPNKSTAHKVIPKKPAPDTLIPDKPSPSKPILKKPGPNKPILNNPALKKSVLNKFILPSTQTNQHKDNKPDVKNMKIDNNVNSQAKTVQTKPASNVQSRKVVDNKSNSPSINIPTVPQKDNMPGAPDDIKNTRNGDSIKGQFTVANDQSALDIIAKKEIINKNGNAISLTLNASQQKDNKLDLSFGIEGTKEVINKNGMSLSVKAAASQHMGNKPEASLGIKGTKNGKSVNAELKMAEGVPSWDVKGIKEFINKNGNGVTLTAGASQQKNSKPDAFLGIQSTKDSNNIEAQVKTVNGKPELSIEGTNEFYNKNGVNMVINAGASLQKSSKPEEFVGIKATKGGDSLNARLNIVDNKVGWDLKGTKNIYNKSGVDVFLNVGVKQQAGGKPEGTAGLEMNFPFGQ